MFYGIEHFALIYVTFGNCAVQKMGYIIPLREAWGIIVLTRDRGRILIRRAEARDLGMVVGVVLRIVGVRRKRRGCACLRMRVCVRATKKEVVFFSAKRQSEFAAWGTRCEVKGNREK